MKIALLLPMTLLLAAAPPRVVHFPGGQALITKSAATQHVVIKDRSGNVTSISDCDADSGSYDQIVAFSRAMKRAALRGDRSAIAGLMRYPLRVNTGAGRYVVLPDKTAFLKRYGTILGAAQTRQLKQLQPNDVFCRGGMAMIANGTVWAENYRGALRGVVINAVR